MAVLRQVNWLSQERVDVPLLRAVESAGCGDFDAIAGRCIAANRPLIVRGFTINTTGVVGSAANNLQLNTADGLVMNLLASESGSFLWVPTNQTVDVLNSVTNPNVVGSFTANTTNNIGIDFLRTANTNTSDLEQFLDPNTTLETPEIVPTARTLSYRIVITTQPFASLPNLVPIATVVTTAQNNVSSIVDCRNILGRLASGGDFPNTLNTWPFLTPRVEGASSSFTGPDKNFQGLKDWMDGVMTRIWESGGGEAWFSGTADRNVYLVGAGTPFGSGDYFNWSGTNLTWQGLRFTFDNSTGFYNIIQDQTISSPGLTDLADGDCIYVDLQRQTNGATIVGHKAALTTVGTGSPAGSRQVIAARQGSFVFARGNRVPVGTLIPVATTSSDGIVRLHQASLTPTHPIVFTDGDKDTATGFVGLDADRKASILPSVTNRIALTATGTGIESGVLGTGGASSGTGVMGTGGAPNGSGFFGAGTGTGYGARLIGGNSFVGGANGAAVYGTAGTDGRSVGAYFEGTINNSGSSGPNGEYGSGVLGIGASGTTGGRGVTGIGGPGRSGVFGIGGTDGTGVTGNGTGVGAGGIFTGGNVGAGADGSRSFGGATGRTGAYGESGPNGSGVWGQGGTGNSIGGTFVGTGNTAGIVSTGGTSGGGAGGFFANGIAATGATPRDAINLTNGNMHLSGANPNSNVGFTNVLTPKNVAKTWVQCHTDGLGNMIVDNGFNVSSVSIVAGDRLRVNFATGLANANFAAVASTNAFDIICVPFKSTTTVDVTVVGILTVNGATQTWSQPSGSYLNSTANIFFNVVVFGEQ